MPASVTIGGGRFLLENLVPERIQQSTTIRVPLQAFLSADHISPATGKTIAVTISKNGGAYANPSGGATNATEIGSGSYYVNLTTTDTGTLGPLFVKGTEGTIDNVTAIYDVVPRTLDSGAIQGTVNDASAEAGGFTTSLTGYNDEAFTDWTIMLVGARFGEMARITSYNGTTGDITCSPDFATAPPNGEAIVFFTPGANPGPNFPAWRSYRFV